MVWTEAQLEVRARRGYELGRAGRAAGRALLLGPVAAFALAGSGCAAGAALLLALLLLAVALLSWRGQEYARAVRPGLAAGFAPMVLPAAVELAGHPCGPSFCLLLPGVCLVAGLVGGAVLGASLDRTAARQPGFWASALLLTLLAGCAGCLLGGLAGLAGMALGLFAGAVPVLALRSA